MAVQLCYIYQAKADEKFWRECIIPTFKKAIFEGEWSEPVFNGDTVYVEGYVGIKKPVLETLGKVYGISFRLHGKNMKLITYSYYARDKFFDEIFGPYSMFLNDD